MPTRAFALILIVLALAGCASAPPSTAESDALPWLDAEYDWKAARVTVTPKDLFQLDPELEAMIVAPQWRGTPTSNKLKRLVAMVYGADGKRFAYRAGHSTTAAQTWRERSGDCLSLTVLTYAIARRLDMHPVMQEVQTPAIYDRAGDLDVVNQHVNLLLPNVRTDFFVLAEAKPHDIVLDFDPDFASAWRGDPLTENAIVARYYNNVAAEKMAIGDNEAAYAYFKAAVRAEPHYPAAYGNVAVLYRRTGHDREAEAMLRHAVALNGRTDVALHELHRLLVDQKRTAEAQEIARRLESRQSADPYYWMGQGVKLLIDNDPKAAVSKFERAQEIAPTFDEIHRYLALAYVRAGDAGRARHEIELASAGGHANKVEIIKRKLQQLERLQQ
jgi:Tfp pilus assembly protein PilF